MSQVLALPTSQVSVPLELGQVFRLLFFEFLIRLARSFRIIFVNLIVSAYDVS